ncbi:hypothetical protein BH18ACT1_BH18ACT1_11580 [soil metagenome]
MAATLARRAGLFVPAPRVWRVEGRALVAAEAAPLELQPPIDPQVAMYEPVLRAAGCDVVVEHGRLVGEVLGLEVVRVALVDGGPRFEVGVGRFDREAHAELAGGGDPSPETLERVVRFVSERRGAGAPGTPLQRLAPERRLRSWLVGEPGLVGADRLEPVAPVGDPTLRTPAPAAALGTADGAPVVVVASTGVDLDLVPEAADVRQRDAPDARLVLALAPRDASPTTRDLASALRTPADVVEVDLA